MKIDLGIKFGGHEIIIYRKGYGIIAKEPAFLAVTPIGKKMKVRAVGKSAEILKITQPNHILVYQPIKNGEIIDEKLAVALIKNIIAKSLFKQFNISYISAIVAVPCAMNIEQLIKLKRVLNQAGILDVTFVENGVCVREYNENLDSYANCMVVDIGKNITDFSILNKFSFVCGRDYNIGGANMDKALQTFVFDNYGLEITETVAEEIKVKIASLYENDMYSTEFSGINEEKQLVKQKITANDVRVAISSIYSKIFELADEYVKSLPKELSAEVFANGIIFSGGGANIQGLYEFASKKLGMPIICLDNPVDAVILGCAKLLDKPRKSIVKIEI